MTSDWGSILSFKGNGALTDYDKYGNRVPAIFFNNHNGYLHFCNAVDGNRNYCVNKAINLKQWYRIEIEQASLGGKVQI